MFLPNETVCVYLTRLAAISALVIAIQMITKYCKKLKYHRKVILVTNGRGSMDADDVEDIAKKINEDDIGLVVLFVKSSRILRLCLRIVEVSTLMMQSTVSRRKIRSPSK